MQAQPFGSPQPLHRGGIGLVEGRVVLHVDDLVREFMEQHARQFALGVADEGAQHRIAAQPVHPAQRGIGRHAVDAALQPLRAQLGRQGLRLCLVEVAAVADTAREREAPGLELQRVRRRRHGIPHSRAAVQVGVAVVTRVVGKMELIDRKPTHALGQLQLPTQVCRRGRVVQPVLDGLGRMHQRQMPTRRLQVVRRVGAAGQRQQREHGTGPFGQREIPHGRQCTGGQHRRPGTQVARLRRQHPSPAMAVNQDAPPPSNR